MMPGGYCLRGFPLGGSCQRPRPLTDEGRPCRYCPQAGCHGTRAPHPALRATFPLGGRLCVSKNLPLGGRWPEGPEGESLAFARNLRACVKLSPPPPAGGAPSQRGPRSFSTICAFPWGKALSFTAAYSPARGSFLSGTDSPVPDCPACSAAPTRLPQTARPA